MTSTPPLYRWVSITAASADVDKKVFLDLAEQEIGIRGSAYIEVGKSSEGELAAWLMIRLPIDGPISVAEWRKKLAGDLQKSEPNTADKSAQPLVE